MPDLHPLSSSNLKAAGYDSESSELTVVFRSGKRYLYRGVPEGILDSLLAAASAGKFFNENIKDVFASEDIS